MRKMVLSLVYMTKRPSQHNLTSLYLNNFFSGRSAEPALDSPAKAGGRQEELSMEKLCNTTNRSPCQGFSKKSLQTRSNPNTIQIRKYLEHKQTPCRWLPSNFPSWTGGDQGVVDQKGRNRPQGRGLWPAWRSTTPVPSCPGGELKE